jgi:hypothetical protein
MAFFQNFFKPAAPKMPIIQLAPIPSPLSRISASTAIQIAPTPNLTPAGQQILATNSGQTPSQYLGALQQKYLGGDMVQTLAHGLPDKEGVTWAVRSAEKVSVSLPPAELQALQAAKTWAGNPTSQNQAAAAAAAAKTNLQGPGALAAQAAAWAQSPISGTPASAATPPFPRMTPHAVAGAVLLSAAIAANPRLAVSKPAAPSLNVPGGPATPGTPQMASAVPGVPKPGMPSVNVPGIPSAPSVPAAPNLTVPSANLPSVPSVPAAPQFGVSVPSIPKPAVPSQNVPNVPSIPKQSANSSSVAAGPAPTVPPAIQAQTFQQQYPFIILGINLAAGRTA